VQICDAHAGVHFSTEQMIHTARCERLLPGTGNIDLNGLMAALPPDLPVSVEVVHHGLEAALPPAPWAAACRAAAQPWIQPPRVG
jgi:sugar phosphate isomerase/epimerase